MKVKKPIQIPATPEKIWPFLVQPEFTIHTEL